MYCKECGIENKNNSLRCKKCNAYLQPSIPLTGENRVKIISFFAFLILPFMWFGASIPIILIAIIALYIMKKDQNFNPIINAKKYMRIYLIIVAILLTIIISISYYERSVYLLDYKRLNPKIEIEAVMVLIAGLIATPITVIFFMFIFNSLFFRPLEEHKNWIIKNGIFSDEKDKKIDSTNVVKRDNLSYYSAADEMLKWHDLLEKGLITQEEFEKIKEKLLKKEKI